MWNKVYSVKCGTCSGEFVGESQIALRARKEEHCDVIRLGKAEKSTIVEPVCSTTGMHEMELESLCIVDGALLKKECEIREALHIGKRKPSMDKCKNWDVLFGNQNIKTCTSFSISYSLCIYYS